MSSLQMKQSNQAELDNLLNKLSYQINLVYSLICPCLQKQTSLNIINLSRLNNNWKQTEKSLKTLKEMDFLKLMNLLNQIQEIQNNSSRFNMKVIQFKMKLAKQQQQAGLSKNQQIVQKSTISVINSNNINFITSNKQQDKKEQNQIVLQNQNQIINHSEIQLNLNQAPERNGSNSVEFEESIKTKQNIIKTKAENTFNKNKMAQYSIKDTNMSQSKEKESKNQISIKDPESNTILHKLKRDGKIKFTRKGSLRKNMQRLKVIAKKIDKEEKFKQVDPFDSKQFVKSIVYYFSQFYVFGPFTIPLHKMYLNYTKIKQVKKIQRESRKRSLSTQFNTLVFTQKNQVQQHKKPQETWLQTIQHYMFHFLNWTFGLRLYYYLYEYMNDITDSKSDQFTQDKIPISIFMILFYSLLDAMKNEKAFFDERKKLISNPIIQDKIRELYGYKANEKMDMKKIINEQLIDRQVFVASNELVFDEKFLKIRLLKPINKDHKKEFQIGQRSETLNKIFDGLQNNSTQKEIKNKIKKVNIQKLNCGNGYYKGLNIVKYLIRSAHNHFQNDIYCLKMINFVYHLGLEIVQIGFFIRHQNSGERLQLKNQFYYFSQLLFLYYYFDYLIKIISIIRIKDHCLQHVQTMVSVDSNQSVIKQIQAGKKLIPDLTINYIDKFSLKSQSKLQKLFLYLWKPETIGMQIMIIFQVVWQMILFSHFQQQLFHNDYGIYYDEIIQQVLNILIILYIMILAAKINQYFIQCDYIYLKLSSEIYEIYGYAEEYLGQKSYNSENHFLQLVIKQIRMKVNIKRYIKKIQAHFFKKNKKKRIAQLFLKQKEEKEHLLDSEKTELLKVYKMVGQLQNEIKYEFEMNSFRLFGIKITSQLLHTLLTVIFTYGFAQIVLYLLESVDFSAALENDNFIRYEYQ